MVSLIVETVHKTYVIRKATMLSPGSPRLSPREVDSIRSFVRHAIQSDWQFATNVARLHAEVTGLDVEPGPHLERWLSSSIATHQLVVTVRRRFESFGIPRVSELSLPALHEAAPVNRVTFTLRIITSEGLPIPEARYLVTCSDGSTRSGFVDRRGERVLTDLPEGPLEIEYPELRDNRAKALAAKLANALESTDWATVHRVMATSSDTMSRVARFYGLYFNTRSGEGLASDLRQAAAGSQHEQIIDRRMAELDISALRPMKTHSPASARGAWGTLR